jgi:hypothetical protein
MTNADQVYFQGWRYHKLRARGERSLGLLRGQNRSSANAQIFTNREFVDHVERAWHAKSDFNKANPRLSRSVRQVQGRIRSFGANHRNKPTPIQIAGELSSIHYVLAAALPRTIVSFE